MFKVRFLFRILFVAAAAKFCAGLSVSADDDQVVPPPQPRLLLEAGTYGTKTYFAEFARSANWTNAAEYCRENGMHLAEFETRAAADMVLKFLTDNGVDPGDRNSYFWIGFMNFPSTAGRFYWIRSGLELVFNSKTYDKNYCGLLSVWVVADNPFVIVECPVTTTWYRPICERVNPICVN